MQTKRDELSVTNVAFAATGGQHSTRVSLTLIDRKYDNDGLHVMITAFTK